jgi:hypothetical protein
MPLAAKASNNFPVFLWLVNSGAYGAGITDDYYGPNIAPPAMWRRHFPRVLGASEAATRSSRSGSRRAVRC